MKKIHIRTKIFSILIIVIILITAIAMPIGYVSFRTNEIESTKRRIEEPLSFLADTFTEEKIGALIEVDYETYKKLKDEGEPFSPLEPGSQALDEYLKRFETTQQEISPFGMTQNGTYRSIIQDMLNPTASTSNSKFVYFGFYLPNSDLFFVSLGAWGENNLSNVDAKKNHSLVAHGYYFPYKYFDDDDELEVSALEIKDEYKGDLFVTSRRIKFSNYDSYDEPIDILIISEIDMNTINSSINSYVLLYFLIALISALLIATILILLIQFTITKKIVKLSDKTNMTSLAIKENRFIVSSQPVNKKRFDEIDELNNNVYILETELDKYMKNLRLAISEDEKIKAELNLSSDIQLSSLNQKVIVDNNIAIFPLIKPAKEVGGDLYDYFYIDDHRFAFFIGDVSGKGVPAALFMMKSITLIKQSLKLNDSLSDSIYRINNELCSNNSSNLFITAFIGVIDINRNVLSFINCGHEPILFNDGGDYHTIFEKANLPLGIAKDFEFVEENLNLKPNYKLFLCTDGVSEATDNNKKLFGEENILKILNQDYPITTQNQILLNEIKQYEYGHDQDDDIAMLSIAYKSDILKISNDINDMDNVTNFINTKLVGVSKEILANIHIIIDELISNVIYYANSKNGEIYLLIDDDKENKVITMNIVDYGGEFNPFTHEKEEKEIGGLGIEIVSSLADSCSYKRIYNANVVIITKKY